MNWNNPHALFLISVRVKNFLRKFLNFIASRMLITYVNTWNTATLDSSSFCKTLHLVVLNPNFIQVIKESWRFKPARESIARAAYVIIPREARPKASRSGVYNFVPQRAQAGWNLVWSFGHIYLFIYLSVRLVYAGNDVTRPCARGLMVWGAGKLRSEGRGFESCKVFFFFPPFSFLFFLFRILSLSLSLSFFSFFFLD